MLYLVASYLWPVSFPGGGRRAPLSHHTHERSSGARNGRREGQRLDVAPLRPDRARPPPAAPKVGGPTHSQPPAPDALPVWRRRTVGLCALSGFESLLLTLPNCIAYELKSGRGGGGLGWAGRRRPGLLAALALPLHPGAHACAPAEMRGWKERVKSASRLSRPGGQGRARGPPQALPPLLAVLYVTPASAGVQASREVGVGSKPPARSQMFVQRANNSAAPRPAPRGSCGSVGCRGRAGGAYANQPLLYCRRERAVNQPCRAPSWSRSRPVATATAAAAASPTTASW